MSQAPRLVKITRSFAYKLNLGNYQSADFFCSQTAECTPNMAASISDAIYQFCKREVLRAAAEFAKEKR
jgi:hypothetical protein